MEDDEFNYHRLVTSEKKVVKNVLHDLFETLWNRKYPETTWAKNAKSVEVFEEKEDEHFQNSLQRLSNKEKRKKIQTNNRLEKTFRDDDWKNYQWDTGKYVYALVDCKLFALDQTDVKGMPASEHIVKIKDIRNKIAHFDKPACDTYYFEQTLESLNKHIKALEILKLNVTPYLEELRKIKLEEKPLAKEHYQLKLNSEKLENLQKNYEEREKHFEEINKVREKFEEKDREKGKKHCEEIKKDREKHRKEIKKEKKKHRKGIKKEKKKQFLEMNKEREKHCEEMNKERERHCEEINKEREKNTEEIKKTQAEKNKLKKQLDEMSAELAELKTGNNRGHAEDIHTSTKSNSKKKETLFDWFGRLLFFTLFIRFSLTWLDTIKSKLIDHKVIGGRKN